MVQTLTAYPLRLSIDYPDRPLNRLTTFFRIFTVIPIFIILTLLAGSSGNQGDLTGGGNWQYGYGAVVFSEAYWGGDFNPYYHTSNDKIEHFNLDYFHKLSKLAVGTLALFSLGSTIVNTEVEEENELNFYLSQNYPNPFNPVTNITYIIPEAGFVSLKIYNVLGREIEILVNEHKNAGQYSIRFIADDLPSGIYFYTLLSNSYQETHKMVIQK